MKKSQQKVHSKSKKKKKAKKNPLSREVGLSRVLPVAILGAASLATAGDFFTQPASTLVHVHDPRGAIPAKLDGEVHQGLRGAGAVETNRAYLARTIRS